jgi:hypothetical protein
MNDAIHEFIIKNKMIDSGHSVFFTGPYQCFCKAENALGKSRWETYSFIDKEGNNSYTGSICAGYFTSILISKIFGQSISVSVILFNIILKYAIMYMVYYIGESTSSAQKATTTRGVFMA